jgi:DNA-directed RNA polymerase specialized sigma24 family protein
VVAAPSDDDEDPRRRRRGLNAASLEAVLRFLDEDRERAGVRYELQRRRLVRYFECKGCAYADEMADETIDRVGQRLASGDQVRQADVGAYFHGFAHNVLRESWRPRRPGPPPPPAAPPDEQDLRQEQRLRGLERCMAALSPEDRDLIHWYYQSDERVHVGARKELAKRLRIGMNALRVRTHRIRARLEACLRARLRAEIESGGGARPGEDRSEE